MASHKTTLFASRASQFLRLLSKKPFVAIVAKDHTAEVFFKGISKEDAHQMLLQLLEEVSTDTSEGDTGSGQV